MHKSKSLQIYINRYTLYKDKICDISNIKEGDTCTGIDFNMWLKSNWYQYKIINNFMMLYIISMVTRYLKNTVKEVRRESKHFIIKNQLNTKKDSNGR